jgi:hypothetical protein
MKKLALELTILCGLMAGTVPALAQNVNVNPGSAQFAANANGRVMTSESRKWSLATLSGVAVGSSTVTFAPCFVRVGTGNRQIFPFWSNGTEALNVPIYVLDEANRTVDRRQVGVDPEVEDGFGDSFTPPAGNSESCNTCRGCSVFCQLDFRSLSKGDRD